MHYIYDSDASCAAPSSFPGDEVSRTDARGIRTCYQHDALHRLTLKQYSDNTPTTAFWYDQASGLGTTFSNPIGHLTSEQAGNAVEGFGYDQQGRIVYTTQATPNVFGIVGFVNNYKFDLAGDLVWDQSTYNRGAIFTTTYDAALRPTSLTSSLDGPLISSVAYDPGGREHTALLGNGVQETRTEDARGRLTAIADGSAYSWSATSLAPDGDVLTFTDSVMGGFQYTLDPLNRLTFALCTPNCLSSTASYNYDRYGNRWREQNNFTPLVTPENATFTGNNNRLDGLSYDAAGNLLNDGTHSYQYDAKNQLISVDNGATASYVYDAESRRVHESVGGSVKEYIYGMGAIRQTIVDANQNLLGAEVNFGGRYLGTRAPSGFVWAYTDNLGSVRQRSNGEIDSNWPFGEYANDQLGTSPLHFTGKYRDSETSLDYFSARYYSSQLGRFLTPDWSDSPEPIPYASLGNPQSLNLYSYVLNNPATATDPDGHWCWFRHIGNTCSAKPKLPVKEGNEDDPTGVDPLSQAMLRTAERESDGMGKVIDFAKAHPGVVLGAQVGLALVPGAGEAEAPSVAEEVAAVLERAINATGNETITVSSREVAEKAEEFVGKDATAMEQHFGNRVGQTIGKQRADGLRNYRDDGDHFNLVNKETGGNLHVRFPGGQ